MPLKLANRNKIMMFLLKTIRVIVALSKELYSNGMIKKWTLQGEKKVINN